MIIISNLLKFIIFADDTNWCFVCKNIKELQTTVIDELRNLVKWFNKLSLNIAKINNMLFINKKGMNKIDV